MKTEHSIASRNIYLSMGFILFAFFLATYISFAWNPTWHNPDEFIQPGSTIPSKQIGENFQYLNKQVSNLNMSLNKLENRTCDFQLQEQSCQISYSCNCGKYGCRTCYKPGVRAVLQVICNNRPSINIEGDCIES